MASHRVALPPPYFLFEEGMVACMASIVSAFILRTSFGQRALPDVCLEIVLHYPGVQCHRGVLMEWGSTGRREDASMRCKEEEDHRLRQAGALVRTPDPRTGRA